MKNQNAFATCAICGLELPRNKFYMGEHNQENPICKDCNKYITHNRNKEFVLDYLARRADLVITDIEDREMRMFLIRRSIDKVQRRIKYHRPSAKFKPFR